MMRVLKMKRYWYMHMYVNISQSINTRKIVLNGEAVFVRSIYILSRTLAT